MVIKSMEWEGEPLFMDLKDLSLLTEMDINYFH